MGAFTVWVLIFTTHVNGGSVVQIDSGYYAKEDCLRVAEAIQRQGANLASPPHCVEVKKIRP
jgi:hypothetical protein